MGGDVTVANIVASPFPSKKLYTAEKGKPTERWGRKAMDPPLEARTARLPTRIATRLAVESGFDFKRRVVFQPIT